MLRRYVEHRDNNQFLQREREITVTNIISRDPFDSFSFSRFLFLLFYHRRLSASQEIHRRKFKWTSHSTIYGSSRAHLFSLPNSAASSLPPLVLPSFLYRIKGIREPLRVQPIKDNIFCAIRVCPGQFSREKESGREVRLMQIALRIYTDSTNYSETHNARFVLMLFVYCRIHPTRPFCCISSLVCINSKCPFSCPLPVRNLPHYNANMKHAKRTLNKIKRGFLITFSPSFSFSLLLDIYIFMIFSPCYCCFMYSIR